MKNGQILEKDTTLYMLEALVAKNSTLTELYERYNVTSIQVSIDPFD